MGYLEIQRAFQERLSFVRSMEASGKRPSPEQLVSFMVKLAEQMVGTVCASAPSPVVAELKLQFAPVWDGRGSRVATGVTLGTEVLCAWLETVVAFYRSKNSANLIQMRSSVAPTAEELDLSDLSAACTRLWELDENRLIPGLDYAIDLQVVRSWNELPLICGSSFTCIPIHGYPLRSAPRIDACSTRGYDELDSRCGWTRAAAGGEKLLRLWRCGTR